MKLTTIAKQVLEQQNESIVNEASKDRMIKQIKRALEDGTAIFKLPMDTQNYYRKNKSDFESIVNDTFGKRKGELEEDNSYVRVSEPKFVKDKNNPNFLYVNYEYDTGGGALTALGKETMAGQIRRLSSAEAMKQATSLAKDLEAKYNLEDIDVYDKENGVVQIFAVSDDFIDMDPNDPNMLKENKTLKQDNLSSEEYQKMKKLKAFKQHEWKWNSDTQLWTKK